KAKAIAIKLQDGENYINIISNIVTVQFSLGNNEIATKLFDEYRELKDSIYSEEKSLQLNTLQTLYETGQKEEALAEQLSVNEEKTRQNQRLIIGVLVLSGLIVAIVILLFQRQRAVKRLHIKEEELHHQELVRLEKEREISALNAMMQGQEEERKRIAEDLHDRLGAKLSAIKLFHESTQTTTNEKTARVGKLLDETITETREIAHNLASGILAQFGLQMALKDLVDTIQSSDKMEAHFSCTNFDNRLNEKTEQALYYVMQELVTNTLRHAEATSLSIQLTQYDTNLLSIVYEDNGKGFDVAQVEGDSMGLKNIRARLSQVNAQLTIDASPKNGSTFLMEVPCL
ncbi:MAG: sensor histidine kinase, partial [Cyclobacteriaceae bacterium]|nr:sensor histidine kinase [Cyclobacteriaceae bacterium]